MINYRNNNNTTANKKKVLDVLSELEEIAKKDFLPSIGPIKGEIIEDIINKYKPKKILEIGTLHGYSAILMANFLLSLNNDKSYKNNYYNNKKTTISAVIVIDYSYGYP